MPKYTVENTVMIGLRATVFLDGVEIENVKEADTDEGYLVCAKVGPDGKLIVDNDDIVMERLTGSVSVTTEKLNAETA